MLLSRYILLACIFIVFFAILNGAKGCQSKTGPRPTRVPVTSEHLEKYRDRLYGEVQWALKNEHGVDNFDSEYCFDLGMNVCGTKLEDWAKSKDHGLGFDPLGCLTNFVLTSDANECKPYQITKAEEHHEVQVS